MTAETAQTNVPDYGPSLPELVRPLLRRLGPLGRVALATVLALLLALVVFVVIRHEAETRSYHQSAADAKRRGLPAIPFHFDHSSRLKISRPAGTYVRAERRMGGRLADRFTVSPLRLGPQQGLVSGFLPILATDYERSAAHEFEGFRLQFEGRARVNDVEGYQFAFSARLPAADGARQLFGRFVMLPRPYDPGDPGKPYPPGQSPVGGLLIRMLATTLDRVPSATRVGDEGTLQRPYRSFRFGS